jgi:hypothetical protein
MQLERQLRHEVYRRRRGGYLDRWRTGLRLMRPPMLDDLRDHNLIRPLAFRVLPDLKAGRPAVALRRW